MLLNILLYHILITQFIHAFRINNRENVKSFERNEKLKHKGKRFRRGPSKDVTNFDLADFINNDGENKGSYDFNYKRRPSLQNDYSYLSDMNLENKVGDSTGYQDKPAELNLGPSEYDYTIDNGNFDLGALSGNRGFVLNEDESANKMRGHDDLLISRSDVQTTGKRCAFKDMKMPFFFHSKSTKSRKDKKRKICFNCKKNELRKSTKALATEKIKSKRSENIKICPVCKSRISMDSDTDLEKIVTPKLIHNSRQYFAEIIKKDNNKSLPNGEEDYDTSLIEENRKRRDNAENNILKELDEVQKKVDNVDINVPNFERRNLI